MESGFIKFGPDVYSTSHIILVELILSKDNTKNYMVHTVHTKKFYNEVLDKDAYGDILRFIGSISRP